MTEVLLHEAMLRYQCNLQGCCCREWRISFDSEDLVRVLNAHHEDEHDKLLNRLTLRIDDQGVIQEVNFQDSDNDRACSFLASDNACGLQVAKGVETLPKLCREFPVHAQRLGDAVELHYDAVCPEVLRRLDEESGPFLLTHVAAAEGSEMEFRTRRSFQLPNVQLGDFELDWQDLDYLRRRALHAFNTRQEPALDTLARINYALARLTTASADDAPTRFDLSDDDPTEPFDRYLDRCVALHAAYLLARNCVSYQRFVFDVDLSAVDWNTLPAALVPQDDWRSILDPRDPALDGLLRNYLCHRFHSSFDRSPAANHLSFTWGTINHSLATTFRVAVGLSRWLQRPVDRPLLKMAIGATEYMYRSLAIPTAAMLWFEPDTGDTSPL